MLKKINLLTLAIFIFPAIDLFAQAESQSEPELSWIQGPGSENIGDIGQINIPEGYVFGDKAMTEALLEQTGNLVNGTELATLAKATDNWFILFEFDDIGYIKDADKTELDADAMLNNIKESTKIAEDEKAKNNPGYVPLEVVTWKVPPNYNPETNNLEWSIVAKAGDHTTINHNIRVLGRKGVMRVTLVASESELAMAVPDTRMLLSQFNFTTGNKYSEFIDGDKVAEYGLGALVAGGAAAALAKAGFFKKFFKLIIAAGIFVIAFLKKLFTGKLSEEKAPELT